MKNIFFQEMRRIGIRYRKGRYSPKDNKRFMQDVIPPFSEGQSFAFRFWAIADRYNSSDIIIDDLPSENEIRVMLSTFARAGIKTFVVNNTQIVERLINYDCIAQDETKVYRRETELYYGNLEIIKGIRMKINE